MLLRNVSFLFVLLAAGFVAVAIPNSIAKLTHGNESARQDDDEKKYSIKQVMKLAHKDGLLKKTATGKATDEEKQFLLKLYRALGKNKPPMGTDESWKKKTDAMVQAAESAVKGAPDASQKLLKATNCKSCHKQHRPSN